VPHRRVVTRAGALLVHADDEFISPTLARDGVWEPAETAYLRWRLRPGMTFLDVGAHVGWFTRVASEAVGPAGRVVAVEPEPASLALLRANVRHLPHGNVEVVGAAASDVHDGVVDLHLAPWNTGDHRTAWSGSPLRRTCAVPTVRLDALPVLRGGVDVAKIDVQGAEAAVWRGMAGLLAASPGLVALVEHQPAALRDAGGDPERVLDRYARDGFDLEVLYPGAPFPRRLVREEVAAYCAGQEHDHVTLVLTRRPGASRPSPG